MKLLSLTQAQIEKLKAQFPLGNNLEKQQVVAKVFNPYGFPRRWYLLNMDPADSDYLWAIVETQDGIEIGSVLYSELQSARLTPFRLPLERDRSFKPLNAKELYDRLLKGERGI